MEVFRKVHLVALLTGAAFIQLPGASGSKVQFLPAAQADAMVEAERADAQAGKDDPKQKLFFKNGIQSIDPDDYYAHDVKTPGGIVTEYRLDKPVEAAVATAAPAQPQFDVNAMAAAMGSAMAQALHTISQQPAQAPLAATESDDDDEDEDDSTPDPSTPQAEVLLAQQRLANQPGDVITSTTANNIAAANSEAGAVNPAADLTQDSAHKGSDAGSNEADNSGTDKTDKTDTNTDNKDKTDSGDAGTGAPKTVASGQPRAARTALTPEQKAAKEAAKAQKGNPNANA